MRVAALALTLFFFWLALSGHYTAWLVGAGAVTAIVVAAFAWRSGAVDREGFPIERVPAGLVYWPWLLKEIVKSAITVSRIILSPRLPITPTIIRIPVSQKTAVGLVTYANSITLTPGTITVEVDERRREFVVHALTSAGASDLRKGEMDRRVARFEGQR